MVVSIDANKQYYIGTTPVPFDSLSSALQPILAKEKTEIPTVVINADKSIEIEAVVNLMKVAKGLGAKTVLSVEKNNHSEAPIFLPHTILSFPANLFDVNMFKFIGFHQKFYF